MSKKITEMVEVADLIDTDWLTGIDNSAAAASKNIKITKANLLGDLAPQTDVDQVAADLAAHEGTDAKTAHPDGINQTDLTLHKQGAGQHTIAGVTGLQAALDAKEDTADLGNAAYRDVGTLSTDVAAGDAPAAAVSAHDGDAGAHGGNIPTTAQKAALDANAGLSNLNAVAGMDDLVDEIAELKSTGIPAGKIAETDGLNGIRMIDTPSGGGGGDPTDLAAVHSPTGVTITSSTGDDASLLPAGNLGNAGVMLPADKTKLDGIEAGATADQTGAEIKVAYEGEANTNAFTDAEKAKLAGIEEGATTDPTAAQIKTLYESNADTNAFTDNEKTKLQGIEVGATVDQTPAEIKTAYESNLDTNAFTDAEQAKLAGIEEGATGDLTAAEIKTLYESNADTNALTDAHKAQLDSLSTDLAAKLDHTGGTLTDYGETAQDLGLAIATTQDIDLANGNVAFGTMTGDTTFTFTNTSAHAATSFTLLLATGGFSPTFPSTWAGDAPDLSADDTYLLAFFLINGTWYGVLAA